MRAGTLARKLFELAGMVLGLYLVAGMAGAASVLGGTNAEDLLRLVRSSPLTTPLAIVALVLLAIHVAWGLRVIAQTRPNNGAYGWLPNWIYLGERASGALLIGYLPFAWWSVRGALRGQQTLGAILHTRMLGMDALWLHVAGLLVLVFHLASGLRGVAIHLGWTVTPRAQRRFGIACALAGVALFALGAATLTTSYRGTP